MLQVSLHSLYQRRVQRMAQVTDDPELLNWWDEVQHKAHPDIKTGWPALRTVTDLRDILTTIAWTATAHHAAVGNGASPPPVPFLPQHYPKT